MRGHRVYDLMLELFWSAGLLFDAVDDVILASIQSPCRSQPLYHGPVVYSRRTYVTVANLLCICRLYGWGPRHTGRHCTPTIGSRVTRSLETSAGHQRVVRHTVAGLASLNARAKECTWIALTVTQPCRIAGYYIKSLDVIIRLWRRVRRLMALFTQPLYMLNATKHVIP